MMNALERRLFNLEQSRRPGAYPALIVGGATVFPGDRGGAGTFNIQPVGGGDQSALVAILAEIAQGIGPHSDDAETVEISRSTGSDGPGVSE